MTRRKGRTCLLLQRVTCTKPRCVATTWRLGDVSMGECVSLLTEWRSWGSTRRVFVEMTPTWQVHITCSFLLKTPDEKNGQFTIVLLTGMTALTEDEDISEAIILKPLPFVVRRASQSANTNTSNNAPFTLSAAALALVVCPLVYWVDVTMR